MWNIKGGVWEDESKTFLWSVRYEINSKLTPNNWHEGIGMNNWYEYLIYHYMYINGLAQKN